MTSIILSGVGTIKLNSFRPLCWNEVGLEAITLHGHPPFIDASCRREPDFENPHPSISALCRGRAFAPHLKTGDVVVYMTVGGVFSPYKQGHHLVSILQVEHVHLTHINGCSWYASNGYPIPSNCLVPTNAPYGFDHTAGDFNNKKERMRYLSMPLSSKTRFGSLRVVSWDSRYLSRVTTWPCFVRTRSIYVELNRPPLITPSEFGKIFGRVPNTRIPNKITHSQLTQLAAIAGIDLKIT